MVCVNIFIVPLANVKGCNPQHVLYVVCVCLKDSLGLVNRDYPLSLFTKTISKKIRVVKRVSITQLDVRFSKSPFSESNYARCASNFSAVAITIRQGFYWPFIATIMVSIKVLINSPSNLPLISI